MRSRLCPVSRAWRGGRGSQLASCEGERQSLRFPFSRVLLFNGSDRSRPTAKEPWVAGEGGHTPLVSSRGHSRQFWQLSGKHGLRQNPDYRWSGVCPHGVWFLFSLFVEYSVNRLYVEIRNASLWQIQGRNNQSPSPTLSKTAVAGTQGLGWAWFPGCRLYPPLTCPPHQIVSCMTPSGAPRKMSEDAGEGRGELRGWKESGKGHWAQEEAVEPALGL